MSSEMFCAPLVLPPYTKLHQSPRNEYHYGQNITLACIDNFFLESGDTALRCGDHKEWEGMKPVCRGQYILFKI